MSEPSPIPHRRAGHPRPNLLRRPRPSRPALRIPQPRPRPPKTPSRAGRTGALPPSRPAWQRRRRNWTRCARSQQPAPQPQALPQTPEELERLIDARAEAKAAQQASQARADAFHEQGRAAYADWTDRCTSLMQMGADAGFSQLLVEMPEGARVAGALADDPEELERIAAIKTERGRAIALGKFAAKLPEEKPAAAPRRAVSRAPAPIRPVNGTANPTFNEYTTDDASRARTALHAREHGAADEAELADADDNDAR